MFSVSRDSIPAVCVLAVVVNGGEDGVSASVVRGEVEAMSSVVVRDQAVGDVLRALTRQGFVEKDGLCFVATTAGHERVDDVMEDVLRVAGGEPGGGLRGVVSGED